MSGKGDRTFPALHDCRPTCTRLHLVTQDEPETYYMTIYEIRTSLTTIRDKLEADRSKGLTKEFTFTKTMIEAEPNEQYPYILVAGENDVVELE